MILKIQWFPGYRLGFFAAITLETQDILLDLNGFEISQSPEFALQQRFYANIALHDQPFSGPQGPVSHLSDGSALGATLDSCTRCVVKNGFVGLSSHHGIRGQGGADVILRDLVLRNHEVAAVHLAGMSRTVLYNVHSENHRVDIPVRATYSQARFMEQYVIDILADPNASSLLTETTTALTTKLAAMRAIMDTARADILATGEIQDAEARRQFELPARVDPRDGVTKRMTDGGVYGLVVSCLGVVVGPFNAGPGGCVGGVMSTDILVKDSVIENVQSAPMEVPCLAATTASGGVGGSFNDVAGGNIRLLEMTDPSTGAYIWGLVLLRVFQSLTAMISPKIQLQEKY